MWGTRDNNRFGYRQSRFIPTYVGNTISKGALRTPAPVHPHVCGEHSCAGTFDFCSGGSSPRMWGTRKYKCCCRSPKRFIPTYVGNTTLQLDSHGIRRFIPTYVGNTSNLSISSSYQAVHPHVCGEHL